MKTIEEKIIEELGYNKESYEAYAAQEDIVAAIHKAQQYERERCINLACEWLLNNFEGGGYVQPHQLEEFRKAMGMEE